MLNREIDKVQAALGYLEACASLHASASGDPVMRAQIQAQTGRVRKALVAVQTEARELREKLERMVEIREAAVDVMGNALRLNSGGFHVYQRPLERLIAALSQPAAEQPAEWDESRIDVIGQNGNDGDHYADAERESLPLMARQEWMGDAIGAMREDPGRHDWEFYYEGNQSLMLQEASEGLEVYRIADTDEHGLPVIERTADMPADESYVTYDRGDFCFYGRPDESVEHRYAVCRIEDYNERGQEGQGDA